MVSMTGLRGAAVSLVIASGCCLLVQAEVQCEGLKPQSGVASYLGMSLSYSTAEHICCNNHRYAERAGYFQDVGFMGKLDTSKQTVFYDSVCGLPLFVAPRGRSFAVWKSESEHHGWPSFRPEEMVSENVIIHPGGRMESKCGTHLGHNLPEGGRDRYCIDLVCMAGAPAHYRGKNKDNVLQAIGGGPNASSFDHTAYSSGAAQWSGNTAWWRVTPVCETGALCSLAAWCVGLGLLAVLVSRISKAWKDQPSSKSASADDHELMAH